MSELTNKELAEKLHNAADTHEARGNSQTAAFYRLAAQRLEARAEPVREALKIEMLGGNCPVQAEGTINGQPFYFRARGEHWSFGVGLDPIGKPAWFHQEEWGDAPFAAGWMDQGTARQLIEQCAALYLARAAIAKAEGREGTNV